MTRSNWATLISGMVIGWVVCVCAAMSVVTCTRSTPPTVSQVAIEIVREGDDVVCRAYDAEGEVTANASMTCNCPVTQNMPLLWCHPWPCKSESPLVEGGDDD